MPILIVLDLLRLQFDLPKVVLLLPECLAALALLMTLRAFASSRQLMINPGFALWFAVMLLFLVFGLIAAEATTGPTVGGIRFYLKYLPFFLMPIVHKFSEAELKFQMLLILGFCLLQAPLSIVQRFILYAGASGDEARGTFATSSMEATFLLMALSVAVACFYQRRISLLKLFACGFLIFIPMTIGEVKGAFLLLPLALLIPPLMLADGKPIGRKLLLGGLPTIAALVLFAGIYNLVESNFRPGAGAQQAEHRKSLVAFFSDPKLLLHYLAPRLKSEDGEHSRSGRIDDILEAYNELSKDPIKLVTGLGIGAVTKGPISAFSSDQYVHFVEEGVVGASISVMLWETGLLGLSLIFVGGYMIWRNAKVCRHDTELAGAIGLGWLAVVPIIFIAFFWKNFLGNDPITAAFAYFTGHVLASAYRQKSAHLSDAPFAPQFETRQPGSSIQSEGSLPPILHTASSSER